MGFLVFFSLTVFGATLSVGHTGGKIPSIKQAILLASPGDTVLISAGTYVENIRFQKSIHLKGEGREKVTIRPGNTASPTIMVENCPSLILQGLTIEGGTIAVSLAMSNARILENTIRAENDGIRAGTFNHSIFIGNNIIDGPFIKRSDSSLNTYGILLVGQGETTIQYNEVKGFGYGMYLTGKKPCRIESNSFSENIKGLFLSGDSVIELLSNRFKNNRVDGLVISDKASCSIKFNVFDSNQQWDIRIACPECDTNTLLFFTGTIAGEGNVLDQNHRLCPVEYDWGGNFFKASE
jgi:parallel beta-helix repeat protein